VSFEERNLIEGARLSEPRLESIGLLHRHAWKIKNVRNVAQSNAQMLPLWISMGIHCIAEETLKMVATLSQCEY
jgi:hypothetical protein